MRRTIIASAAALFIGGASVLTLAVPAFADTAPGTPVTVEVTGGTLTISAPTSSVDLGSAPQGGPPPSARRTSPGLRPSQPARSARWSTPPQATVTGTATVTPSTESTPYPGGRVQDATNVNGSNTATWDPTIAVTIPANALAGTYATSITHSVS